MNDTQNVFVVFFAILWGTAANSQPRWKSFQFPLVFKSCQTTCRVILSIILLNILPILYFGWTLWMLSGNNLKITDWQPDTIALLLIHSVIPAFATFGFYRMWIGVVELNPTLYYFETSSNIPEKFKNIDEPTIESLKLNTGAGLRNIIYAFIYIIIGLICSQIFR
jgi:hypothetical protein